jgi:hypothetical protein
MATKYLRELVDFAQREVPLLKADLQNASTQYALQATCQRMFDILTYMLHHAIHAAYENGSAPAAAPAPAPAPPPPVAAPVQQAPAFTQPAGMPRLPPPSLISQPVAGAPSDPTMADIPFQPGVANVIITAQGTKVVSPTGATSMVPPGEHVGLEATLGTPPQPYVEPGVATVVLPPGGGMSPDVLAALSQRSGQAPE